MLRLPALFDRRACALPCLLALLAVSLLSCAESKTTGCGAFGLICPEGLVCSSDGASCVSPTSGCGDGVIQTEAGEQCDDGNTAGSDGCSSDCKSNEQCGNGQLDLTHGEICDDGNKVNGDGCSSDCRSRGACGNGIVDPGEPCDDGNDSNDDDCLQRDNLCIAARCGDGFVNTLGENKEVCDYGADKTACDFDCTPQMCGDGLVNGDAGEQCDPPGLSGDFFCTSDCKVARCGDGITSQELGEVCDDGNRVSGDQCSADCLSNETCGNGTVDVAKGEQCDDGNTADGDGCSSTCRSGGAGGGCGNGIPDAGEECDTAGESRTCNLNCTLRRCGDAIVNIAAGEECDAGGGDAAHCDADCTTARCGDGYANPALGESCDDGDKDDNDDCLSTCTANVCGDGSRDLEGPSTEACDDGNTTTEAVCPYGMSSCTTCSSDCTTVLNLKGPSCGDGVLNGVEVCDDGNTVTEASCPYGTQTCTRCDATCSALLSLTGSYCGDGVVDGPEVCDDNNTEACGTCDATCSRYQLTQATGTIQTVAGSQLFEGETFSLSDGLYLPRIFEFDSDGAFHSGHFPVIFSAESSASDVATAIEVASNSSGLELISVTEGSTVELTHRRQGSLGNQLIIELVNDPAFTVKGLSGGSGLDCPVDTGCASTQDCAPSLTCDGASGTCIQPPSDVAPALSPQARP